MATINPEQLSPFGQAALRLDETFNELARVSGRIERLDLEAESDVEHGLKLLMQFAEHGQNISAGIEEFAKRLQEARERSEIAAQRVGERAELIRQKKNQQAELRQQLMAVEEKVKTVNAGLVGFRKEGGAEYSDDDKLRMRQELERVNVELKKFIDEAQAVKDTARSGGFKSVEREAQVLLDALKASSRKVDKAITG
jgi:hypothetical protein